VAEAVTPTDSDETVFQPAVLLILSYDLSANCRCAESEIPFVTMAARLRPPLLLASHDMIHIYVIMIKAGPRRRRTAKSRLGGQVGSSLEA
jgi:hypothetical protein